MERNIKLVIEYDGTNYHGWQSQPNQITIQQTIEEAIENITREKVHLKGSGRTDAKVHAYGQIANFRTNSNIPYENFKYALNSLLPKDISIKESCEVNIDFNARYDAVAKEYRYIIYNNKIRSPIIRNYSYHVPYELNFSYMEKAIKEFIGTHDFRAFMYSKSDMENTVRTILNANIEKNEKIIEITLKGNGFLYNMVRIITGTLVDVGRGKIKLEDIANIIESKKREKSGHTAPPQGLYLSKVFY